MKQFRIVKILFSIVAFAVLICFREFNLSKQTISKSVENGIPVHLLPDEGQIRAVDIQNVYTNDSVVDVAPRLTVSVKKWRETIETDRPLLSDNPTAAAEKNAAANELFSLPELPDGVVSDLARMFRSTDEDEVWRDYCLQFLGGALEREDGVTDEDRALARETLVEALASTNATFAGTALRALHRGDPADPLVAASALRISRDPSYPSSSRTTALLILEDRVRATASTASTASTTSTTSTLAETASAISSDPSASSLLRRTAEAVQKRSSVQAHDQWNDRGGSQ